FSGGIGVFVLDFFDQWDPRSPWHDRRVRLAASYAVDRRTLSEAERLGASKPTGNIVQRTFEFALSIEPDPDDPVHPEQFGVAAEQRRLCVWRRSRHRDLVQAAGPRD